MSASPTSNGAAFPRELFFGIQRKLYRTPQMTNEVFSR